MMIPQGMQRSRDERSTGTVDHRHNNASEPDDVSSSCYDPDASRTESNVQSVKAVKTYPDSENEFHDVIRNQNWDLLEILLKEYDYRKFSKNRPKERQLRVVKYIPDFLKKTPEVHHSPLHGLDALGRAPLHLGCLSPCPEKDLTRLINSARDIASVPDATGSLPLHLAVTHNHSVDIIDKLIRAYRQGATQPDGSGRTALMWAIEMVRQVKEDGKERVDTNPTFWANPRSKDAAVWQKKQARLWQVVGYMLENRQARKQKLTSVECRRISVVLGLAATPAIVSRFLDMAKSVMKNEQTAGPALSILISRQYSLDLLVKFIEACPMDFAKEYSDGSGRGLVSAHYRIGCIAHQEDASDHSSKRESFRMIMQNLSNAAGNLQAKFTPGRSYEVWWEKLKFLINLWGTHMLDEDASHDSFDFDDLLLHNALSNSDVPPSLIRLLATLRPNATDLEHPKSSALPIHLACRVWRYKLYPPRKGEKESHIDKVVLQLLDGDLSRTRKRYKDRLPIHHAIAAGHQWMFIKPLVVHDRKSLQVRDPKTKLYPFQLAASYEISFDLLSLARRKFTTAEWNKLLPIQKEEHLEDVRSYYCLGQLTLIYQILRRCPTAINHEHIVQTRDLGSVPRPRRTILARLAASEQVTVSAQVRVIRNTFGLGPISGHFIAWAYENTRRGWKTHRSNFGVLKEAIMDGFIASSMDEWWRALKFFIWSDCRWESPTIPHRDDFLLHGALSNPDTSPWIINLILECFPRSASIPLPGFEGCFPLHIACVTDRYIPLPFEFANGKTVIGMIMKAYPDAALLKWRGRLPLHLAISHSNEWQEIKYLAQEEVVALSVVDPEEGLFPFQLMAIDRPFTSERRKRFEVLAERQIGITDWNSFAVHRKVHLMKEILEQHEKNILDGVWELLRLNSAVSSVAGNKHNSGYFGSSTQELKPSRLPYPLMISAQGLSPESVVFLEDFFEEHERKATARKARVSSRSLASDSDHSLVSAFRRQTTAETRHRSQTDMKMQSGHSKSSLSTDGSLVDPFVAGAPGGLPPLASKAVYSAPRTEVKTHKVMKSPGACDSLQSPPIEVSNPRALLETSSLSLDTFAGSEGGTDILETDPVDFSALCRPRRKDIVFLHDGSAYVIWRRTVLPPGSIAKNSRKGFWAELLKQIGEQVTLSDLYTIRHEHDQLVLSSALIEGTMVLIDEDDTYVWIICGKESCCAVENYDIDAAYSATSVFLDGKTGVWLEDIVRPQWSEFSNEEDSLRIMHWVLSSFEKPIKVPNSSRFMISHSTLRASFANGSMNGRPSIEESTRKLCFDVAKLKMQQMLPRREFIGVRFFVARRMSFQRQRVKFKKQENAIKFMKHLKKRQRRARKLAAYNAEVNTIDESSTGKIPKGMLHAPSEEANKNPTAESMGQQGWMGPRTKPATTYEEATPMAPAIPSTPKEVKAAQTPLNESSLKTRGERGTKYSNNGRSRGVVSSMQASMNMDELYAVRSLSPSPPSVTVKDVRLNSNHRLVSTNSSVTERRKHPWEGANSLQGDVKQRYQVEDGSMNISELFDGSLPPGSRQRPAKSAPHVAVERVTVNKHSSGRGS